MDADEANEIAESVSETAREAAESFRKRVALAVGFMAMLLAIASLGGENAMKDTINSNILASNAFAFYQARNIRQDIYVAMADLLETQGKDPQSYRARAEREAKEKATLLEEAHKHDGERATAQRRDANFDYSRAFFQIAIVLGSVSIVAASRALIMLSGLLALAATLFAANGFLLLI
ncbi:MAG TPA: DUF4337 family protein [Stellaceae bacterium]|nr:DUF4337 family protein [Stellaceae bacterium]